MLAGMFNDEEFRKQVRHCNSAEDLFTLLLQRARN
jgi:mannitol/fructose-specific phosphotransferase system IIA component (Ntr-type)